MGPSSGNVWNTSTYASRPRARRSSGRWRALLAGLLVAAVTGGCPAAPPPAALFQPTTLAAERVEWRGTQEAPVWLRRHTLVFVGAAADPSTATSILDEHTARATFRAPAPAVLHVLAPASATVGAVHSRLIAADGAVSPLTLIDQTRGPLGGPPASPGEPGAWPIDPSQRVWTFRFGTQPPGTVWEAVVRLEVPGTLAGDARWLGTPPGLDAAAGVTAERLVSYDLPDSGRGALAVVGAPFHPLETTKGDRRLYAIMARDVAPARGPRAPYVRYATAVVSPRNYNQRIAGSWAAVAAPYAEELVTRSKTLRGAKRPPYLPPAGPGAGLAAYRWVHDRLQRPDALQARWDSGRPLPPIIRRNDLTAVDKFHLLQWILEASSVPHRVAVGRTTRYPALTDAVPAPGAFDVPLLYLPGPALWLDPGCPRCQPGEVRPALAGGQALLLPARHPPLVVLPGTRPAPKPTEPRDTGLPTPPAPPAPPTRPDGG